MNNLRGLLFIGDGGGFVVILGGQVVNTLECAAFLSFEIAYGSSSSNLGNLAMAESDFCKLLLNKLLLE